MTQLCDGHVETSHRGFDTSWVSVNAWRQQTKTEAKLYEESAAHWQRDSRVSENLRRRSTGLVADYCVAKADERGGNAGARALATVFPSGGKPKYFSPSEFIVDVAVKFRGVFDE